MPISPQVDVYLDRRRARIGVLFNESYAALALVLATIIALVWANIGHSYHDFWQTTIDVGLSGFRFEMTLHEFVDEFLMALFFFVIGLDVRRELSIGELRRPGRALLPVVAALGGLIVPVVIFLVLNGGSDHASAWGTVISTDSAFALGMLALIGPRNAPRLRLFLLTVAVVDDIGALLVIAVAYTAGLNVIALGVAVLGLLGIFVLQRLRVWRTVPYLALGTVVWAAVYESGVHATIAGVLIALLMPVANVRRRDVRYADQVFELFRQAPSPVSAQLTRQTLVHAIPLNQRLSAILPPYVNYIIVPLFAVANAGVVFSADGLRAAAGSALTWGIVLGLMIGKTVGIMGGALLVMKLVPASKLPGLDGPRLLGVGTLTGMGFTISLLVVSLAIEDPAVQAQARIGVLAASLFSLLAATLVFRLGDRFAPLPALGGESLPRPVDPRVDHIFGDPDAPVTLVVYAAMDRGYREGLARSLRDAARPFLDSGELRIVYRHRITRSSDSVPALALEAAAKRDSFCELHDELLDVPGELDLDTVVEHAAHIGLDPEALRHRIGGAADQVDVEDDALDGIDTEGSEPVLFLQDERIPSSQNSWHLARRIRQAIESAPERDRSPSA